MANFNVSAADAILKEYYADSLTSLLNNSNVAAAMIAMDTSRLEGRRFVIPVHSGRSAGIGARADDGTLPTADRQSYSVGYAVARYLYGRVELTGPVIASTATSAGAFVEAITGETDGVIQDLERDYCRQIFGESTGVIATCGTTSSSTTVQLLASSTSDTDMLHLWNDGGMIVDIGTVADPDTVAASRTVTAYDATNKTITISGAAVSTTSGTHFVFRAGNGGGSDNSGLPGDGQLELTGLQDIVDDTSICQTLNPSTVPNWASKVYGNSGSNRSFNEPLLNKALMETEVLSGSRPNLVFMGYLMHASVAQRMEAMRRNVDSVSLLGGYDGIRWSVPGEGNGNTLQTALVWTRDNPENQIMGLSTEHMAFKLMADWSWMDRDGAIWSRVADKDAYEATKYTYRELVTFKRNAHFRIDDLSQV